MNLKLHYILGAFLLLSAPIFTSCSDDVIPETESNQVAERFELTVTQKTSRVSAQEASSRVGLEADGLTTYWEPGDQLVLIDKKRELAPIFLTTTLTEKAPSATFVAETGVPAGDYYVIYNYNDALAYSNMNIRTPETITADDKLVLWGLLSIPEGTNTASIALQHLYAKVRFDLVNFPVSSFDRIGIYSNKRGFAMYKMFTKDGLVDALYGLPDGSNDGQITFFPSTDKIHNLNLLSSMSARDDISRSSALILPADFEGEDLFFYVGNGKTFYEFKKQHVTFNAGTSYKVVLDYNQKQSEVTLDCDESYTFKVKNPAEWRAMAYVGFTQNINLTADIDFQNEDFLPLGAYFFNGNTHTVRNVSHINPDENNMGIFRYEPVAGECGSNSKPSDSFCMVSDLTLENIHVSGKNYVGALAGNNIRATNCKLLGKSQIEGTGDYVGGLVGCNWVGAFVLEKVLSSIYVGEQCVIQGKNNVGGIMGAYKECNNGYSNGTSVDGIWTLMDQCVSKATITATGDYVGGIFGRLDYFTLNFQQDNYTLSIQKCTNLGNVTGKSFVGGIGGDVSLMTTGCSNPDDKFSIKQSFSFADVSGEYKVGGLLGSLYTTVNTCYSRGKVSASKSIAGGLVGHASYFTARILNSYSLAEVQCPAVAGGILGSAAGAPMPTYVKNCYFAGTNSTDCGIVGESYGAATVLNCLTTLPKLGANLGNHVMSGEQFPDIVERSEVNVKSILDRIAVINGDNAYSKSIWPLEINPAYCVKFADFSVDTNVPNFDEEVIN